MLDDPINLKTLTFGQLKDMIDPPIRVERLPSAKALRKSDVRILIDCMISDANITVFQNGLVIYTRDTYSTVTTASRCSKCTYNFVPGQDELRNGGTIPGCNCHITSLNGRKILRSVIPEAKCNLFTWYLPIVLHCEERLCRNADSRERSKIAFYYNHIWNIALGIRDDVEIDNSEFGMIALLIKEIPNLPPIWKDIIYYLYYEQMTKEQATDYLGYSVYYIYNQEKQFLRYFRKLLKDAFPGLVFS